MIDLKQKIVPFLWYPRDADIAVQRYLAVFGEGRVLHTQHWGEGGPVPAGSLMAVTVELAGQTMVAFNGGPHEAFNDAASMFVTCDSQAEIDRLVDAITAEEAKIRKARLAALTQSRKVIGNSTTFPPRRTIRRTTSASSAA